MMGIKVKPDSKYLTHDTVTSVNNLVGAIQGVACHFVPELTDENFDAMFDAMGVPKTGSTPCAQFLAELDVIYGDGKVFINTHSPNIPPNLIPIVQNIGQDLHILNMNLEKSLRNGKESFFPLNQMFILLKYPRIDQHQSRPHWIGIGLHL